LEICGGQQAVSWEMNQFCEFKRCKSQLHCKYLV